MRILIIDPLDYPAQARQILEEIGEVEEQSLTRDQLKMCIADYHVLIVRLSMSIDREILELAHQLKVIVSATTGLDHIDMEFAESKNIQILSLFGESEFLNSIVATAEHTWGLILALTRRIPWAFDSVRQGIWDRNQYRGHDLRGQRLGILGLGRIGKKVASYGLAFGMQVFAYDPYTTYWTEGVQHCASLSELLSQADILSIHLPLNTTTSRIIGYKELALLPQGAMLVNTARGQLIDEQALLQALQLGKLIAAALDVVATEWDEKENPLVHYSKHHQNLVITPHIGGATFEAMADTEIFMAHKLRQWYRK